jgi:hypothetical protein
VGKTLLNYILFILPILYFPFVNGKTKPGWQHICYNVGYWIFSVENYYLGNKTKTLIEAYLATQELCWSCAMRLTLFSYLLWKPGMGFWSPRVKE